MPIYEYQCNACERVIEAMVKMGARGPRKCAECSGRLQKIVSRTSFQLKGGGWYAHGYGNGSKKAGSGSGGSQPSTSDGDSKAGTKSEAKADKTEKSD